MQSLHDYQGFPVNLNDIALLMNYLGVDNQTRLKKTGFGNNKVRSLLDYLKDFGLITEDKKSLSELGKIFRTQDENLSEDFAKWLCLYNWSKSKTNPALYFLLNFARNGDSIKNLTTTFKEWASENKIRTDYQNNYAENLFKISQRSLTEANAFQGLSLIRMQQDDLFRSQPYNVHPLLIAYILYDNSRDRKSISIFQLLSEPGNVGQFFGYDEKLLNKRLEDLENLQLVQRVQNANLNMIQLNYEGRIIDFVKRFYA